MGKKIYETTGSSGERAAELGNKLLNAGFPITIMDDDIRDNAVQGIYEPECRRWIYKIKEKDILSIIWEGRNETLYTAARSIKSSHWNSGCMEVSVKYFKEVLDFADIHGFKFTRKALETINDYEEQLKNAIIITPAIVLEPEPEDKLKEILGSSREIIEDLKEE